MFWSIVCVRQSSNVCVNAVNSHIHSLEILEWATSNTGNYVAYIFVKMSSCLHWFICLYSTHSFAQAIQFLGAIGVQISRDNMYTTQSNACMLEISVICSLSFCYFDACYWILYCIWTFPYGLIIQYHHSTHNQTMSQHLTGITTKGNKQKQKLQSISQIVNFTTFILS